MEFSHAVYHLDKNILHPITLCSVKEVTEIYDHRIVENLKFLINSSNFLPFPSHLDCFSSNTIFKKDFPSILIGFQF